MQRLVSKVETVRDNGLINWPLQRKPLENVNLVIIWTYKHLFKDIIVIV